MLATRPIVALVLVVLAFAPTAIPERLARCKSNTQPLKDSFLHLKGSSFFLVDGFVASLSSVHRLGAELLVRPAIHSGWRWTYNLTALHAAHDLVRCGRPIY